MDTKALWVLENRTYSAGQYFDGTSWRTVPPLGHVTLEFEPTKFSSNLKKYVTYRANAVTSTAKKIQAGLFGKETEPKPEPKKEVKKEE